MSVWDDIDNLKRKHAQAAEALKNAGDAHKFRTEPSQLNALHWIATCRRRDCKERLRLVGSAAELPALMLRHSSSHEPKSHADTRADARKK